MTIRNRVLLCLMLLGLPAALWLAFLAEAPNRLVSGQGQPLAHYLAGPRYLLLLPLIAWLAAVFARPSPRWQLCIIACSGAWLGGLTWLAGDAARSIAQTASPLARTSLGGAFWLLCLLGWLAAGDATARLPSSWVRRGQRQLWALLPLLPVLCLLASGQLDELSLLKEYHNRREVFTDALVAHLTLVLGALLPTLALGLPLGWSLYHRPLRQGPVLAVLNLVQTLPAIALFGLLIGPLAALAAAWPALGELGIQGVGAAPALIALTLYALLPITRSVLAGLVQVPATAREAATAMGLNGWQLFRQLELPLALPVLLAGLRLTVIQLIGLAMLAALVGAGGLGTLMFQGLASSALDLILLGVLPAAALTLLVDAGFKHWAANLKGALP